MRYFLRGKKSPVPETLAPYLSELQILGLMQAQQYGWHLDFIRRPEFDDALAYLSNPRGEHGILREDGSIFTDPPISVRH